MTADDETWKEAWRPVVDAVGRDMEVTPFRFGADVIEAGPVRRYLEPLEFDCALHYDPEVARAHGFDEIIAPYTAMSTFAAPAHWRPGKIMFDSAERDAQPAGGGRRGRFPDYFPPYTAQFATDVELEFLRPARVGERLGRRGRKLIACDPRATKVGRGAFLKMESEIINTAEELLARMRFGIYLYTPYPRAGA